MNLPNFISLGRLLVAPVILWLMLTGAFTAAFWLFMAAAVSDAVDGAIAKRFDRVTQLGAYLDPIADKVLLVSVFLLLGSLGLLPLWIVILVVSRDALIVGGAILLWMLARSAKIRPSMISKVNTVLQLVLAAAVLGRLGLEGAQDFASPLAVVVDSLMVLVAASTVASGAGYLAGWTRDMSQTQEGEFK